MSATLLDVLVAGERLRAPHRACRHGHVAWIETKNGWRCLTCRRATNLAAEKRRYRRWTAEQRAKHRARVAKDWHANHDARLRQHRAARKLRVWAA